ncbi:hypothetical protein K7X08_030676 [Anisodus acutangulus]|uniref:Uncharacterized protein n=1 Tax=Anisodus acutangulus TaxID=402998 RepID=A0A9Q1RAW1_9SOLA|nr:hypothetical protein K7X08_030676 [Anisodus acutangulus]
MKTGERGYMGEWNHCKSYFKFENWWLQTGLLVLGHQGDLEVCTKSNGHKGCQSGCEVEQVHLEQRNPKCPKEDQSSYCSQEE